MRQPLVAPTSMYSMKRRATLRPREVTRHRHDLAVVGAALDDHVDLDRSEAGSLRRVDAAQHGGDREVGVVHAPKDGVVERVEGSR